MDRPSHVGGPGKQVTGRHIKTEFQLGRPPDGTSVGVVTAATHKEHRAPAAAMFTPCLSSPRRVVIRLAIGERRSLITRPPELF